MHEETVKEYNRRRYRANYRQNFIQSVRSYANILRKVGYSVEDPTPEEFDSAIDSYLAARPRRDRF